MASSTHGQGSWNQFAKAFGRVKSFNTSTASKSTTANASESASGNLIIGKLPLTPPPSPPVQFLDVDPALSLIDSPRRSCSGTFEISAPSAASFSSESRKSAALRRGGGEDLATTGAPRLEVHLSSRIVEVSVRRNGAADSGRVVTFKMPSPSEDPATSASPPALITGHVRLQANSTVDTISVHLVGTLTCDLYPLESHLNLPRTVDHVFHSGNPVVIWKQEQQQPSTTNPPSVIPFAIEFPTNEERVTMDVPDGCSIAWSVIATCAMQQQQETAPQRGLLKARSLHNLKRQKRRGDDDVTSAPTITLTASSRNLTVRRVGITRDPGTTVLSASDASDTLAVQVSCPDFLVIDSPVATRVTASIYSHVQSESSKVVVRSIGCRLITKTRFNLRDKLLTDPDSAASSKRPVELSENVHDDLKWFHQKQSRKVFVDASPRWHDFDRESQALVGKGVEFDIDVKASSGICVPSISSDTLHVQYFLRFVVVHMSASSFGDSDPTEKDMADFFSDEKDGGDDNDDAFWRARSSSRGRSRSRSMTSTGRRRARAVIDVPVTVVQRHHAM